MPNDAQRTAGDYLFLLLPHPVAAVHRISQSAKLTWAVLHSWPALGRDPLLVGEAADLATEGDVPRLRDALSELAAVDMVEVRMPAGEPGEYLLASARWPAWLAREGAAHLRQSLRRGNGGVE